MPYKIIETPSYPVFGDPVRAEVICDWSNKSPAGAKKKLLKNPGLVLNIRADGETPVIDLSFNASRFKEVIQRLHDPQQLTLRTWGLDFLYNAGHLQIKIAGSDKILFDSQESPECGSEISSVNWHLGAVKLSLSGPVFYEPSEASQVRVKDIHAIFSVTRPQKSFIPQNTTHNEIRR